MTEPLRVESSSMSRWQLSEFMEMARDGHGWVLPRPDGTKAPCGGPMVCRVCKLEHMVYTTSSRVIVMDGFVLKPGDKLLLLTPPHVREVDIEGARNFLRTHFPEVDITVMAGFTGVQIHRQEPA